MTVIGYESYEGTISVSSNTFVIANSLVFSAPNTVAPYILNLYCEVSGNNRNSVYSVRAAMDGAEGAMEDFEVPLVNSPHAFNAFRLVEINEGSHTITLEVKSSNAGDTIYVRRMRIYAMQH